MKGEKIRAMLRPELLARVKHFLRGGLVAVPKWVRAAEVYPPLRETPEMSVRGKVSFPETRLVNVFLERNPTYKSVPIDLLSDDEDDYMPLRFARRQAQLMEERGATEEEARVVVEQELGVDDAGRASLYEAQCREALRVTQAEEEKVLQAAMEKMRRSEQETRVSSVATSAPKSPRSASPKMQVQTRPGAGPAKGSRDARPMSPSSQSTQPTQQRRSQQQQQQDRERPAAAVKSTVSSR